MKACERGPAPALLVKYSQEVGANYRARRLASPSYSFTWPQREGESLYDIAHCALVTMTSAHCAYCDGHPLDATGEDQIDHFRPKSWRDFYEFVCRWENLFLCCCACNKAKREQWQPELLRPDDAGYSFDRFFEYRTDTGELEPNSAAPDEDQHRATRTIAILDLNRPGACTARRSALRTILAAASDDDLLGIGYRFLLPLATAA